MKTLTSRVTVLAIGLSLALPAALSAHEGHAGDHGWLAGAAQPLLSLDHFLAGLFVAVVATLGVTALARHAAGVRRGNEHLST